jgi:hypothetical protein
MEALINGLAVIGVAALLFLLWLAIEIFRGNADIKFSDEDDWRD